MGLTLPSELTEPLGWIGLTWPEADEELLFEAGQQWISYGEQLTQVAQSADAAAGTVWQSGQGEAVDAFQAWWTNQDGPRTRLAEDAAAAVLIGSALLAFAAITLALKIAFIVQLILLAIEVAQAIATAFVTFGATTAEVPGFIAATRLICRKLIQQVIEHITTVIKDILLKAKNLLKKTEQLVSRRAEATAVARAPGTLTSRLQGLFNDSEVTQAGRSFYESTDQTMRTAAKTVPADPGHYTVDMHGNPNNVFVGNNALTPNDLADLLENDPNWNQAQPIRLMACETGQDPNGFAQQLADRLGVPVKAPDQLGWSDTLGNTFSASAAGRDQWGNLIPTHPPDGAWVTFQPSPKTP